MLSSVRSFRSSTASLVLSSFSLSFVFPFTLCSFTVFLSRLPSSVPSAANSIRQSEPQEIGGAREFHRRICVLPPFLRSLPPTTILTPASSSFVTRSFHLCLPISFSHCFSASTGSVFISPIVHDMYDPSIVLLADDGSSLETE